MTDDPHSESPTVGLESTASLLLRVKEGDAGARNRLMIRFREPLRRWARGRSPRGASHLTDTDDFVQNALLNSLKHVEAFEPRREGAFLAYLRMSLMNQIRDEARKMARRPVLEEADENLPDPGPSPLEETVGKETMALYEAALSSLPPDDQQAVVLRIELGFSYPKIAEAIGSPSANAARMKVVRALESLAEGLR